MDRLRGTVDSGPMLLLNSRRQFQHDGAVRQKNDGSIAPGIPAEGNRIQRDRGVLIHPQECSVSENGFHPGLSGRVQTITGNQRHIDHCLKGLFAPHREDRGIAFEIGNVTQRGRIVLNRGHPHQGCHQYQANGDEVAFHGDLLSPRLIARSIPKDPGSGFGPVPALRPAPSSAVNLRRQVRLQSRRRPSPAACQAGPH